MDNSSFDVIIVGAGLFGSAAAKHLSLLRPGLRLALLGPGEPRDRADTEASPVTGIDQFRRSNEYYYSQIFGCWHDEGRLYHAGESGSSLWGKLSRESIKRFYETRSR